MEGLGAVFLIVGTCIGAGFVSGAELVRFFGADGFFLPVLLSSSCFFAFVLLFLAAGRKYGGYEGATGALFQRLAPAVRLAVLLLAFIPCAGLISGLDALAPTYKPLPSLCGLALVSVFVIWGVKGIKGLNAVLVPLLLLFVFLYGNPVAAAGELVPRRVGGFLGGAVYAGMNAFLALPVLMDAGAKLKRVVVPSAAAALPP